MKPYHYTTVCFEYVTSTVTHYSKGMNKMSLTWFWCFPHYIILYMYSMCSIPIYNMTHDVLGRHELSQPIACPEIFNTIVQYCDWAVRIKDLSFVICHLHF